MFPAMDTIVYDRHRLACLAPVFHIDTVFAAGALLIVDAHLSRVAIAIGPVVSGLVNVVVFNDGAIGLGILIHYDAITPTVKNLIIHDVLLRATDA